MELLTDKGITKIEIRQLAGTITNYVAKMGKRSRIDGKPHNDMQRPTIQV